MRVEVLTVPGCPNREAVMTRVGEALDRTGLDATVAELVITDPASAATVGMLGSPTVLVDGRDVCDAGTLEASFSCRLYRSNTGVEGAPGVDVLIDALTSATGVS